MRDVGTAGGHGQHRAGTRHDLRAIGIADLERLREVGVTHAWIQLNSAGSRDCLHSLLALEGALRGVRWMEIDPDERDAIAHTARAALAARGATA